jgi:hypothetical protein
VGAAPGVGKTALLMGLTANVSPSGDPRVKNRKREFDEGYWEHVVSKFETKSTHPGFIDQMRNSVGLNVTFNGASEGSAGDQGWLGVRAEFALRVLWSHFCAVDTEAELKSTDEVKRSEIKKPITFKEFKAAMARYLPPSPIRYAIEVVLKDIEEDNNGEERHLRLGVDELFRTEPELALLLRELADVHDALPRVHIVLSSLRSSTLQRILSTDSGRAITDVGLSPLSEQASNTLVR